MSCGISFFKMTPGIHHRTNLSTGKFREHMRDSRETKQGDKKRETKQREEIRI